MQRKFRNVNLILVPKEERKQQCIICDEDAVVSLSPDLDIRGLGACEIHREDVSMAYGILMFWGEDDFDKFLADCRKKPKNC